MNKVNSLHHSYKPHSVVGIMTLIESKGATYRRRLKGVRH